MSLLGYVCCVFQSMSYRDNTRQAHSPPPMQQQRLRQQQQQPAPSFEDFNDFDDPPSPDHSGYGKDRIQNDLLDEICSDIGIKDAIDLDVFDFDVHTDQYIIQQNKLADDLLGDIDQTIPFGSMEANQQNLIPEGAMEGLTQIPGLDGIRPLKTEQPKLPRATGGENSSIASPTISSRAMGNPV